MHYGQIVIFLAVLDQFIFDSNLRDVSEYEEVVVDTKALTEVLESTLMIPDDHLLDGSLMGVKRRYHRRLCVL